MIHPARERLVSTAVCSFMSQEKYRMHLRFLGCYLKIKSVNIGKLTMLHNRGWQHKHAIHNKGSSFCQRSGLLMYARDVFSSVRSGSNITSWWEFLAEMCSLKIWLLKIGHLAQIAASYACGIRLLRLTTDHKWGEPWMASLNTVQALSHGSMDVKSICTLDVGPVLKMELTQDTCVNFWGLLM